MFQNINTKDNDLVLTALGRDMDSLEKEERILILGTNEQEYSSFENQKYNIFVYAIDIDTQKEYLYLSKIEQGGTVERKNIKSSGVSFLSRRYARRDHKMKYFLYPQGKDDIKLDEIEGLRFFCSLEIKRKISGFTIFKTLNPSKGEYLKNSEIDIHTKHLSDIAKIDLFGDSNINVYSKRINNNVETTSLDYELKLSESLDKSSIYQINKIMNMLDPLYEKKILEKKFSEDELPKVLLQDKPLEKFNVSFKK